MIRLQHHASALGRRIATGALALPTCLLVASCVAFTTAAAAAGDAYPSRSIRIIVPNGAGGAIDLMTREIAAHLERSLGQPVVIENRAGASGVIGAEFVRASAPDGYTLLASSSSTNVIVPHVQAAMRYDGVRDFAPIVNIAWTTKMIVVHPSLPVHTLRELVSYAKAHRGELNYASTGPGSSAQLDNEMFSELAGIKMVEIPYRTISEQTAAVLGNHVQVNINSVTTAGGAVREGRLRALAVISPQRSPLLPDVPTMIEAGYPGLEVRTWSGLSAPRGTPPAVIALLNAAVNKALADPALVAWMSANGYEPIGGSAAAFLAQLEHDDAIFRREVARLRIRE
ncbi:MAG: tripartite tricarboxylate transporter substrate binding protein [Casimicrobiaceae bacterium]